MEVRAAQNGLGFFFFLVFHATFDQIFLSLVILKKKLQMTDFFFLLAFISIIHSRGRKCIEKADIILNCGNPRGTLVIFFS